MLHVTIALHEGLNGSLTGTGAVEAPGAGATMTLEVNFRIPGQEETHHMSVRIGESNQLEKGKRFNLKEMVCRTAEVGCLRS